MSLGQVGLYEQISQKISPFFKFANGKNPNVMSSTWVDEKQKSSKQRTRTHRIFSHCVSCNTEKFSKEDWSEIERDPKYVRLGTDTYFCQPCAKKVIQVGLKFEDMSSEASEILNKIWNQNLFGPLRSAL